MTDRTHRTVVLDGERLKCKRKRRGLKISEVPDFIAKQVRGFQGGISEATYRRAENGRPVFVKSARIIAEGFEIPFEKLVLQGNFHVPLGEVDRFLAKVRLVIHTWLREGYDGVDGSLPEHPEFVYRLEGEWKGRNAFYGVAPGQPTPSSGRPSSGATCRP